MYIPLNLYLTMPVSHCMDTSVSPFHCVFTSACPDSAVSIPHRVYIPLCLCLPGCTLHGIRTSPCPHSAASWSIVFTSTCPDSTVSIPHCVYIPLYLCLTGSTFHYISTAPCPHSTASWSIVTVDPVNNSSTAVLLLSVKQNLHQDGTLAEHRGHEGSVVVSLPVDVVQQAQLRQTVHDVRQTHAVLTLVVRVQGPEQGAHHAPLDLVHLVLGLQLAAVRVHHTDGLHQHHLALAERVQAPQLPGDAVLRDLQLGP